jgi:MFS family permease
MAAFDSSMIDPMLMKHSIMNDMTRAFLWYGIVQIIAYLALIAGIFSPYGPMLARRLPVIGAQFNQQRYIPALAVALVMSLGVFGLFIYQLGGYEALIFRMYARAKLMTGARHYLMFLPLLLYAILILIYSMRQRRSWFKWILLITLIAVAAGINSSFGGRKATLIMFIAVLIMWHYGVQRFRRVPWQAIAVVAILIPYVVAVPIIRKPGALERYLRYPEELWPDLAGRLQNFVGELSYVDTYIFIYNYFTPQNVWLGQTYLDLPLAPIPSQSYPDKPPIDDGVYVRSLMAGMSAEPGTPYRLLYPSSNPPETAGIMYLNFWVPGVIIGMFLLGVFYQAAYKYMEVSGYTIYSVVAYVYMLTTFHLSNLGIIQTLLGLGLATVYFLIFFGRGRRAAPAGRAVVPGHWQGGVGGATTIS